MIVKDGNFTPAAQLSLESTDEVVHSEQPVAALQTLWFILVLQTLLGVMTVIVVAVQWHAG